MPKEKATKSKDISLREMVEKNLARDQAGKKEPKLNLKEKRLAKQEKKSKKE